jgi:hypothetical protein
MIIDGLLRLSDGQALTSQGTVASTNVIDLAHARDIGVGDDDLEFNVGVSTTFTSDGSGTLAILAQGSVDNSNWTTYSQTDAYAKTALTQGTQIVLKMPRRKAGAARPRYIRLAYVVGTADMTAGALKADLVHGAPSSTSAQSYPAGIYPSV